MATMLPENAAGDAPSRAERIVRRRLAEGLGADWTVIHGARWIGPRHGRDGQDGEIDFLLIHPARGVVVLEVKGGLIARDGPIWTTTGQQGTVVLKQSPLQQAADGKRALIAAMQAMRAFRGGTPHVVHAAALPDCAAPGAGFGADAPRSRLLVGPDLADPEAWAIAALASADPHPSARPLGAEGVRALVGQFATRRTLPRFAGTDPEGVDVDLLELTEEQFHLLDQTRSLRRVLVRGGPGSGKSLLAVEAARRFAESGRETLLLCFNAPLAGRLAAATRGVEGLTAAHFHALCREWGREAGIEYRLREAEERDDWSEGFAEILFDAASRLDRNVDAIVVDEGQDFDPSWWPVLEQVLRSGDGVFYVFDDPSQSLYASTAPPSVSGLVGPIELRRNCRNPAEIHAFLRAIDPEHESMQGNPISSGARPTVRWIGAQGDLAAAVDLAVAAMRKVHGLVPSDIAVITPRKRPNSALGHVETLGGAPVSWRDRASPDHIWIDTTHRHKGLEHRGVIACEFTPDLKPSSLAHLRVACTRATYRLTVVASHAIASLLRGTEDLTEWRGPPPA